MQVAVIGAGISGLAAANLLKEKGIGAVVYESKAEPGGLIRCTTEKGNLFHRVGGHVFNTKNAQVNEWFWNKFNKEREFIRADRNAKIWMDGKQIGYPIENHIYQLPDQYIPQIIKEILEIFKSSRKSSNFGEFLQNNFGKTLYELYFKPYNIKIWKYNLSEVPLPWLDGKLPMPDAKDLLQKNITREGDKEMVHNHFFYPQKNGSSFIANRLAKHLNIQYNCSINSIEQTAKGWRINNKNYTHVIYTGDVRELNKKIDTQNATIKQQTAAVTDLPSNGTSNVLCFIDSGDLSWLYIPSPELQCHRIIYTGNFSAHNNTGSRPTCTIEFSGKVSEEEIKKQIKHLPGNPSPIAFNYEPNSYVIQRHDTREKITKLQNSLNAQNFYLVGRFAEWEYYNMDMAIASAIATINKLQISE